MDVNGVVLEGHDGGLSLLRNTCVFVYGFGIKLCINLGGACFAVYLIIMAMEDLMHHKYDDDVVSSGKHGHHIAWNWSAFFNIISCVIFFSFFMCGLVSAGHSIFTHFFATQKIEPVDNTTTDHEDDEDV
ncbi:hypothetical protein FNV43_RR16157 [Rhamnella rubrinervis]|uniref:Uncharacterized protein n=1 Tax=Rhamnella rubrinervis TaxID=2594499 RepID=A0A8K0GXL9_9ROSA|nr:hypothetical protein FNV43_RR16157 [Rhamnella rubrinervis]